MQLMTTCLIFTFLMHTSVSEPCKPTGIQCKGYFEYQLCVNVNNNGVLVGQVQTCPDGTLCNDAVIGFACVPGTVPTTTTPIPVTEPTCSGPLKSPATLCYQYYECVQFLGILWWSPELKSCPYGQGFDASSRECVSGGSCNLPAVPDCTGAAKYPGPQPNQYYECRSDWFSWKLYTVTCKDGEIYSQGLQDCAVIPTTTTTTTAAPVTAPTCTEAGRYPAPSPNQYYECKYSWFFWQLSTVTCPDGTLYRQELQDCAVITTITTTTAAPATAPATCTEAAKYPSSSPDQYYECKYSWFAWRLYVVTCPTGQVYNATLEACT